MHYNFCNYGNHTRYCFDLTCRYKNLIDSCFETRTLSWDDASIPLHFMGCPVYLTQKLDIHLGSASVDIKLLRWEPPLNRGLRSHEVSWALQPTTEYRISSLLNVINDGQSHELSWDFSDHPMKSSWDQ